MTMPTVKKETIVTPITQTEIEAFFRKFIDKYDWRLVARMGTGNKTDDSYDYLYVDDIGISITLNPNNKGFRFLYTVDFLFKLKSDEFTPWDFQRDDTDLTHFEKNYVRFRKVVKEKNL